MPAVSMLIQFRGQVRSCQERAWLGLSGMPTGTTGCDDIFRESAREHVSSMDLYPTPPILNDLQQICNEGFRPEECT